MVERFFDCFGKSMRSIIAFSVVLGGFAYMFKYPDKSKTEIITVMMVVVGYYFTASKDRSDEQKAKLEIEKQNSQS
jgi:hypothetical protein